MNRQPKLGRVRLDGAPEWYVSHMFRFSVPSTTTRCNNLFTGQESQWWGQEKAGRSFFRIMHRPFEYFT